MVQVSLGLQNHFVCMGAGETSNLGQSLSVSVVNLCLVVLKKNALHWECKNSPRHDFTVKSREMTLEREGVILTGSKSFKGKLEADENKLLSKKYKHLG